MVRIHYTNENLAHMITNSLISLLSNLRKFLLKYQNHLTFRHFIQLLTFIIIECNGQKLFYTCLSDWIDGKFRGESGALKEKLKSKKSNLYMFIHRANLSNQKNNVRVRFKLCLLQKFHLLLILLIFELGMFVGSKIPKSTGP